MAAARVQPQTIGQQFLEYGSNGTGSMWAFRVRDLATGKLLYATRAFRDDESVENARLRLLAYATDEQVQLVDKHGAVKIAPLDRDASTPAERWRWGRPLLQAHDDAQTDAYREAVALACRGI